jgi:hypothetical protein
MRLDKTFGYPALFAGTILWIIIWRTLASSITDALTPFIRWQLSDSLVQCLAANSLRISLYVWLFYGQMVIIRNSFFYVNGLSETLFKRFELYELKNIAIQGFRSLKVISRTSWKNNFWLIFQTGLWIVYWFFLSLIILFMSSASHVMGNCDDTDLECGCHNIPYFLTAMVTTELIGSLMLLLLNGLISSKSQR